MMWLSILIISLAFPFGVLAGAVLMALAASENIKETYRLGYELGKMQG